MTFLRIALLAIIQGLAELLPVSSSAHVIFAEKLMGLDPSAPEWTFLLVMLHTGTTFAVILYFWPRWKARLAKDAGAFIRACVVATAATGAVGLALKHLIEKIWLRGAAKQEVEALFSNLPLIACALGAAGVLILLADRFSGDAPGSERLSDAQSGIIGAVQGLCLPFRGFSRSGATISSALWGGVSKALAEDFSFALSVILTPLVIGKEGLRLMKSAGAGGGLTPALFIPGAVGMVFSFLAGLLALRWLSAWLENGKWRFFGYYCLAASAFGLFLSRILH